MKYEVDMRKFWETNKGCANLKGSIPRVPVDILLGGDFMFGHMEIDESRYYSDFDYQQETRLQFSKVTEKEFDYTIYPTIDFGVIMDASIYGGTVNYVPNAAPTLTPAINDPEEVDAFVERMNKVDILEQGLIPKYLEWREKLLSRYGIGAKVGGSLKGCATTLGQICSITNFLTWIMTDPEQVKKLIACWLESSKRYIRAIRKATGYPEDASGFSLYSDVSGMLSPELYREFIFDAEKNLYEAFAPNPDDKRFYHADSHMLHQLENLRGIGVNEVNVDPYIDCSQILEKMPDVVIYGQIPPMGVMLYGTPEDVIAYAKRDIEQAGPGKHLVLTTAGGISDRTPFENLKALCYAVEKYGYIY